MNINLDFDSCGSTQTPVGPISVYAKNGKITYLHIGLPAAPVGGDSELVIAALAQVRQYFDGKRKDFDLPVQANGTEFQKAVWQQVAQIPFGQTRTYADIAQALGKPLAARAVGGAVGSNPVALIIGCHRVMGASGKITGYSGGSGIPTKRWLLKHEGISSVD
jgi:methylated-DNA-[protein]-cysteine S-methyltransferase